MSGLKSVYKTAYKRLTPGRVEKVLILVIGIAFFTSLLACHVFRAYTSDDVTTQLIVQNWTGGEPRNAVVGAVNYVIKMPFFALQDWLMPHNSRLKIFIDVLACNAVLFFGVIYFLRFILDEELRRSRLTVALMYLPTAWYLGLSILPVLTDASHVSRVTAYMNPNYRNAEMGIALLFISLFYRYVLRYGRSVKALSSWLVALVFVGLAIFLYSDQYFIYTLIVPSLLLVGILWLRGSYTSKRLIQYGVFALGSVWASLLIGKVGTKLGYTALDNVPRQFIDLSQLGTSLTNTLLGHFKSFSAEIWGQPLSLHLLPQLLNALLLCGAVGSLIYAGWRWRSWDPRRLLLVLIALINIFIFTFTTTNGLYTDRYLIFAMFAEVLLLSWAVSSLLNPRLRIVVASLLAFGLLVNFGVNSRIIWRQMRAGTSPNAVNYQVIQTIEKQGVSKGFADYWDGNIDTYLSSSKVRVLPAVCDKGKLYRFYWALNATGFDLPSNRSFYLYSTRPDQPAVSGCTADSLQQTLGIVPAQTVPINESYTLYIYDQDISQVIK